MRQRTNYLALAAVTLVGLTLVFGIYSEASFLYKEAHERFPRSAPTASSTTEISTERLAELEVKAARFDAASAGVRTAGEAGSATTTATSSAAVTGSTTPRQVLPATVGEGEFTMATIIGRPPQTPYDTAVLSAGRADGIFAGAVVWEPSGIYLGEVTAVREKTATLRLVSTAGETHQVRIGSSTVAATGRGGDSLYAELSQGLDIAPGQPVISDRFGLPLGVVAGTQDIEARNLQGLYISRRVPTNQLETVYVQTR